MINSTSPHDTSTNGSGASRPADAADIFSDLAAIRLTPDEAGQIGSEEVMAHVSVRKPTVNEFVRVNPDPAMSLATSIFVDAERETYLVAPNARSVLVAGVKAMLLVPAVNQRGLFFIWPIALGDGTGRRNAWHDTAREAAELAKREWIKLVSDMAGGCYRIYRAKGKLVDPVFPEKGLEDLLRLAFRGRVVDSEDHPVVKQALGLIP
jgi:hypothetical protein